MVGWDIGRVVEVKEGIADGILERMVDRAAALVPDGAFVNGDILICGGAWVRNAAEEEEERMKGGC